MVEKKSLHELNPSESVVMTSRYSGPDRRADERRESANRRQEARVEGKLDRRSGRGRRQGEQLGLHLRDIAK